MKKILFALIALAFAGTAHAQALTPRLGGTGLSSAGAGDVGLCLKVLDNSPFTYELGTCGGGGGGSDGNWTFFNGSGVRLATTSNQVRLGGTSTTTNSKLEITGGISFDFATGTKATTTNFAISSILSSLLKTNGTGGVVAASAGTDYEVPLTFGDGLTRTLNDVDVDTTQNIAKLSNLTGNGFVKTSGGDGTLSVDTTTYESGLTAGDGLTRTTNDFDCDTASGTVFGCLTAADWTTFNGKLATNGALTGTFDGQEGTYYLARANHTGTQAASTVTGGTFGAGSFVFPSGSLTSLGSTTLQDFTANTATTTNLIVAGITGSTQCLRVNSLGQVSGSGADCGTGSGGAYPFAGTGNSTSTLTQFNAGLTAYASSTIGGGNNSNGLTIWGKATTTSLLITSLTSELLKVDASGNVLEAVSGTDYSNFGAAVGPTELESADFGSFTCNGTTCSVDNGAISNTMLANSSVSYGGVSVALGASDATPAFNLADATGLPISTGVSGLGTGVATALGVNVGSAGAFVTFNGALGTPSSGTLTNATGLPISTGVSGLGANVATWLATPSSANLISAVTDETGTGALVFGTSPAFTTPNLGTPSAVTLTNGTGLPIVAGTTGTLSVARGGTGLTTFGGTNHVLYTTGADTLASEAAFTYSATGDLLTVTNASTTRLTTSGYTILATGGGNVGISTTTPNWTLNLASTTPAVTITDTNAGANRKHWILGNYDGVFAIGTSTDALTSTSTALSIDGGQPVAVTIGATTTATGILNLAPNPGSTNGTTTITMGKIQFSGYGSDGTLQCVFWTGAAWGSVAGACNN